jgi:hypothetical protein
VRTGNEGNPTISLVVLVMMEFHGGFINVRLKSVVRIREGRKLVRASLSIRLKCKTIKLAKSDRENKVQS